MKPLTLIEQTTSHPPQTETAIKKPASLLKKILIGFGLMVLVLVLFVITPFSLKFLPTTQDEIEQAENLPKVQKSKQYIDAYIWTAKLKLEDLKLNHRLQITTIDPGVIKIKGNISTEEKSSWKNFLNWYGKKDSFPKLSHDVETTAIGGNIPELKSVWFDANPTAYFLDGRFGNIGTVLDDGWKIISIETWAVFVERNGVTITLTY